MAIKFFNIRSKETRIADSEPKIAAMWSSSDRSPNITQGQDFGWRLAPEVVVEMEEIMQDPVKMERIAVRQGRPLEDIGEKEVLTYISSQTALADAPVIDESENIDEYQKQIRDERAKRAKAKKTTDSEK